MPEANPAPNLSRAVSPYPRNAPVPAWKATSALAKLAPVMGEIAKPMGSVDRISIVDFGGKSDNSNSLARFAQTVPLVLT